jgi:uncharacterized protein (TIGR02268 family)
MRSSSAVLLVLALVLARGSTAAGQPEPATRGPRVRRIELRATTVPGEEPEVFIHPGTSTVLAFDGVLARDPEGQPRVELERQPAFTRAEVGETVLRLIPSRALKVGERLRLTVRFPEGAALSEAMLVLVVHAEQADRLVEVEFEPRSQESFQREVRAAWEAVRQCHEALARVQAAPGGPDGLTALRISEAMGEGGVVTRSVSLAEWSMPSAPLLVEWVRTYRSTGRVLVEVVLRPGAQARPWTADSAALTGGGGETLKVLSVWQDAPLSPGRAGWVLVEAEAAEAIPSKVWTLRLWEEATGHAVVQGGIDFPELADQGDGG